MPRLSIALSEIQRRGLERLARAYTCEPSDLAAIAVTEMLAAHRRPRRTQKAPYPVRRRVAAPRRIRARHNVTPPPAPAAVPTRRYKVKACRGCGTDFTPSGPRASRCANCRDGAPAAALKPATPPPAQEFETIWDGTKGRQGASLTGR